MAILIQQQTGCINIIDTARTALGEEIVISLGLDCVATPFARNPDDDYIKIADVHGKTAYKVILDGTLEYQDNGGSPIVWAGTLDSLNNKLNNEYFITGSGGGGSGGSTEAKQDTQIAQEAIKEERFYFNFDDIENEDNIPTFPLTCGIDFFKVDPFASEGLPSATYATIEDFITAANTLTFFKLEKRTETSFYVLDGTEKVSNLTQDNITLHGGLTFRVYRFYRLNKGSYPATNLSVSDLILEESKYASGTGLTSIYKVINPVNLTLYGVKQISVVVAAEVDEEVNIKTLDKVFSPGINYPVTLPKGQYLNSWSDPFPRPNKNPIVINNTGDPLNYVLITVTY